MRESNGTEVSYPDDEEKYRIRFPDPTDTEEDGLLCIGGNLEVETLLEAYRNGIFPWPHEGYPMLWFSPLQRGVLDFSELHIPARLSRMKRNSGVEITFDRDFARVISSCRNSPRAHEAGTWILPAMEKAYLDFHAAGYAHSVEAWRDGNLVGGLYGVFVEGVFSGESMFYLEPNASKLCLLALIERLQSIGLNWMDTQMVTPVVESLGGKLISRDEYLTRLKEAQLRFAKLTLLEKKF